MDAVDWSISVSAADFFSRLNKIALSAVCLALVAGVGWVDYLTKDISVVIFYLTPISLAAWFGGFWTGLLISVASVVVWHFSNLSWTSVSYSSIAEKLGFFFVATFVICKLQRTMESERRLSRTDHLTGLLNRRFFYELLLLEINRSRRYLHPLTVIYIDADGFKAVNDEHGHQAGDLVLQLIGTAIRERLRSSDQAARLGGDEFCIMLPETDGDSGAATGRKIQESLNKQMADTGWRISFSVGIATYLYPPANADDVIAKSDALMLAVKKGGKNGIQHRIFEDEKY